MLVAGGDMDEPIADEVRGILDGHIVLSRALGERNHWPAIDVLASLSRVMNAVADAGAPPGRGRVRELLAAYEQKRDLILLGAYKPGSDPRTDEAIAQRTRPSPRSCARDRTSRRRSRRRASACWRCVELRRRPTMSDCLFCKICEGRSLPPSPIATTRCSLSRTSAPRRRSTSS